MKKTIKVETLGCRLNAYESEAMRKLAGDAGHENSIIINTCAVTHEAVRASKQRIRKLRRENPDSTIIVTGCAAQIDPKGFAELDDVDHIIGNSEKTDSETWARLLQAAPPRLLVNDIMSVKETASHLIDGFGTRARAYVQVQNGCDHRCTFCIIPYGRGQSRSTPARTIVEQIKRLCGQGFQEIVLTGVDITSWGADLPNHPPFSALIEIILNSVPELPRLRISSIDSVEIDDPFFDIMRHEKRLMPHLHLSLQAGHNMILKRMKRRHSREDAIEFCQKIREIRSEITYGADIIAGFPTETDEMFQASLDLIEQCNLTWLHIFPFSPRIGTPAAKMPQIEKHIIKARAAKLREVGEAAEMRYLNAQCGVHHTVLMETPYKGRSETFAEVYFNTAQDIGKIVHAKIIDIDNKKLIAEKIA